MKLFSPVGSASFSTALAVYGCHLAGLRGTMLGLAAIAAGVVAFTTALTVALRTERQPQTIGR